jgi:hypothetical protein
MFRTISLAAALTALPAQAFAADWSHAGSGVSIPESVGDMKVGQERDLSGGKRVDVSVQYGSETEPVTLYVYRSAFPNPALWFERTRHAMASSVGLPVEAVSPRAFTFGGAAAPNGLREEAAIAGRPPWKSTAVAIAQAGEWVVKARISSQSLDREGIAAKMDRMLGAIRLASPPAKPLPLLVPGPCGGARDYKGKPVAGDADAELGGAMVAGVLVTMQARGAGGLGAEPAAWCREASGIPAQYASVYRRRDGSDWVALVGDSGMAVQGQALTGPAKGAATFGINPSSVRVVALFDDVPAPDAAVLQALPVVTGQQSGLVEISTDAKAPK